MPQNDRFVPQRAKEVSVMGGQFQLGRPVAVALDDPLGNSPAMPAQQQPAHFGIQPQGPRGAQVVPFAGGQEQGAPMVPMRPAPQAQRALPAPEPQYALGAGEEVRVVDLTYQTPSGHEVMATVEVVVPSGSRALGASERR
jgi:hypothetical protein